MITHFEMLPWLHSDYIPGQQCNELMYSKWPSKLVISQHIASQKNYFSGEIMKVNRSFILYNIVES